MKVLSHILLFAYCVISCIIADENNLEVDEELQRWEEYKVEKKLFKKRLKSLNCYLPVNLQ